MKRTIHVWLAGVLLIGVAALPASAQNSASDTPLGDYARAVRNNKKPQTAKQFDNDNLPKDDKLSVVGSAATATAAAGNEDAKAEADNKASEKPEVKPGQSQQERQAVYEEWQSRIASQKARIDLLARELDVTQREYKLRAAAMYGDAGDRLRNEAAWDKEDADYKQQIAEKQKALDEAKNELTDIQEDARKSGVPTSVREDETMHQEQPQQPQQPQAPVQPQAQPATPEPK